MLELIIQGMHRFKKRFASRLNFSQIPLISSLRKIMIFAMRKKIVEDVNGYTMYVDDRDTLALSWHHTFEPVTTDFFKKNIKYGQTVIDLGANIGYFTLLFSGLVGSTGHVYAFEPEPENANLLRKNLELNSIKNVTVIQKAVDSKVTTRLLHINKKNRGNHQIFYEGEYRETIEVQSTTLDDYFSNQDLKIDWIKMDIEGAEVEALQGMKNLIYHNPKLILVTEIFAPGLIAAGSSVEEYILALNDLKFEFEKIDEGLKSINHLPVEELIGSFSSMHSLSHPNIICRRA